MPLQFRHLFAALLVLASIPLGATRASAATEIKWPDLQPKLAALSDPLAHLTEEQKYELQEIIIVRNLSEQERKQPTNAEYIVNVLKYEDNFRNSGLDLEKLITDYKAYENALASRQKQLVTSYNGKKIRIAGYLLPLEMSGTGATEFLLVPYFGACVHVPPPPANQIVFVKLKKTYPVGELFTPVWVTGILTTKPQARDLELGDGKTSIQLGYEIAGQEIEPYKQ